MLLGAYMGHLVDLCARFGVEADELLEPLGLTRQALAEAGTRLEVPQIVALVERARALTGEPGLGVYLGLATRASWHGYLGFAVLTARNIGEAMQLAERFIGTRTSAFGFRHVIENGLVALTIDEHADLGPARDAVLPALTMGLSTIAESLTGRELDGRVEFAFPRPAWADHLDLPRLSRCTFGAAETRLLFDAGLLALPFQLADASAQKLAEAQCERELAALGFSGRITARVRELVLSLDGLDAAAKALSMSSRTLKRRLAAEGTTFTEVLDQERRARALVLLEDASKSIKEIGASLGFADTAAFSHAFTRWTGKSPTEWRKKE